MTSDSGTQALARLIKQARRAVVFTGAGISTESGIPDFRSPGGIWTQMAPIGFSDFLASDAAVPACDKCLGHVKTATISFGQAMPVLAMRRAEEETLAADLFIVLGSSLVVYPAAGFPELAKRNGAALAIVNREPTLLDRIADLVIQDSIGDTMGAAVGVN